MPKRIEVNHYEEFRKRFPEYADWSKRRIDGWYVARSRALTGESEEDVVTSGLERIGRGSYASQDVGGESLHAFGTVLRDNGCVGIGGSEGNDRKVNEGVGAVRRVFVR